MMDAWIQEVWLPFAEPIPGPLLLMLDAFAVHQTVKMAEGLGQVGTTVEYLPGGTTGQVQILDVRVNRPFNLHLQHLWHNWMVQNEDEDCLTPKMHHITLSRFIADAWDAITPASIPCSTLHIILATLMRKLKLNWSVKLRMKRPVLIAECPWL